jgi:2-dehydropantoate 2-reductase
LIKYKALKTKYKIDQPIHILGAGGIGVALAWCLLREGREVILVDTNPDKILSGQRGGLTVVGHGTDRPTFVNFRNWIPPKTGFILLCTKTYDNPIILERLADKSLLVPVQNGFDPQLDHFHHPGEGIASFVSECRRDRPITRITRPGALHIGARRKVSLTDHKELALLGKALAAAGVFPVEIVADIRPYKFTKLMYNAAISPLAAAAGVDNGELLSDLLAKRLFFALLQENYAILRHANLPLAKIGPFHPDTVSRILRTPLLPTLMAFFFRPSLRGTYCSMAPDIHTDCTEIEAYNGHLIRLAKEYPCPLNRAALNLINTIVNKKLPASRQHLQTLVEQLPAGALS